MAKPPVLPDRVTMIQRLFSEMPDTVSRDPLSVPVLALYIANPLSTTDTASISIFDGIMVVNSSVSYIDNEIIMLSDKTINDIMTHFNGKYGYRGISATYTAKSDFFSANFLASTFLEGIYTVSSAPIEIDKFTSVNYALLQSLALSLVDQQNNKDGAIAQFDMRSSSGKWLDYWGLLFGVNRTNNEYANDYAYRTRLQSFLSSVSVNNLAIENYVTANTGRDVSVKDGGRPYSLSGTSQTSTGIATFSANSTSFVLSLSSGSVSLGQSVVANTAAAFTGSIAGTPVTTQFTPKFSYISYKNLSSFPSEVFVLWPPKKYSQTVYPTGNTLTVNTVTSGTIAIGQDISSPAFAGTRTITSGSGTSWTISGDPLQTPSSTMVSFPLHDNISSAVNTIAALPLNGGSSSGTYSLSIPASGSGTVTFGSSYVTQGTPLASTGYIPTIFQGSITYTSYSGTLSSGKGFTISSGNLNIGDILYSSSGSIIYRVDYKYLNTSGTYTYYLYPKTSSVLSDGTITLYQLKLSIPSESNILSGFLRLGQSLSFTYNSIIYTYNINEFLTGSYGPGTYALLPSGSFTPISITLQNFISSGVYITGATLSDPNGWTSYINAFTMGPNTGTGSFIVLVKKYDDETDLPYNVSAQVISAVNQWKPAGVPFSVQSY